MSRRLIQFRLGKRWVPELSEQQSTTGMYGQANDLMFVFFCVYAHELKYLAVEAFDSIDDAELYGGNMLTPTPADVRQDVEKICTEGDDKLKKIIIEKFGVALRNNADNHMTIMGHLKMLMNEPREAPIEEALKNLFVENPVNSAKPKPFKI